MKQNYLFLKLMLVSGTVLVFSCGPFYYPPDPYVVPEPRQKENVYYAPPTPNAPLLSEKNDGSFSMSYANTPKHDGFDLTAAFLPAKNVGLSGGYSQYSAKADDADGSISHYQFGAGYIKPLNKIHFEVYGGIGGGNINNDHHTGKSKIDFTNYFIQPTFAVQNAKKTIQFAFVSKFTSQHFKIKDTAYAGEREPFVANQFKLITDDPNRFFWEPALIFRGGGKNVMFQMAFSVVNDFSKQDFIMGRTNVSVGIIFKGNLSDK